MEWYEVELHRKRTVKLTGARWDLVRGIPQDEDTPDDYLGGIIQDGELGWVTSRYTSEATLLVHRLAGGQRMARHTFWRESGNKTDDQRCSISCVEEIFTDQPDRPILLAVCLESWNGVERRPHIDQVRSQVHLYSLTYYQVLRILDIGGLLCQSLAYLDQRLCSATQLSCFDGCLAVGTVEGIVLLIDLNYEHLLANKPDITLNPGIQPSQSELHRIPGNKYMRRIDNLLEECRSNDVHLSVELDVTRVGIRCLVGLGVAPGFAAGLDDGRILIYDLIDFQLTTTLRTPRKSEELGAVERLCAIVPPDDPKPCFYICAMYKSCDRLTMILHSVNYSSVEQVGDGFHFKQFFTCSVRNQQVLDMGNCSVTGCSTASTFSFAGDNGTLLAILSWRSDSERKNKLVLFDMNQWYKDEMPEGVNPYDKPNYLVGYILNGLPTGLALLLRPTSILHFVALQRYEEHFYPNSLTFDCTLLTTTAIQYYAHDGVHRRFLEALRKERATLFLRPQLCHANIVRLRLLPQFCELNVDATFSKSAMYDVILSVALEHRCTALLEDCASSWLDGSFLCNMLDPTELSLATLTNWILRRAGHIKKRISELCQGVFDYGGYSLDERERREFEALSGQMSELVRLQSHVLTLGRRSLTSELLQNLESNERALQTVNEYQKVLYWFIDVGLLPEGQHEPHGGEQQQQPLVALRRSYAERRAKRRRLYIDSLTKQTSLVDVYPPDSLQALLHVMLDPDTDLESKHKLLLYMLLDLDQELARTFPLNFHMHEPNARLVTCFWWLDRGDYKQSLAALYEKHTTSPRGFMAWETGLLVETLLEAGDNRAAMRVLSRPPGAMTKTLHLDVLLVNNCVPEAFHYARTSLDARGKCLVEHFFRHCIENRRYKVLAELCLTDEEEQMVYRLLQENPTPETERVQLILLLLKSKYIEAAEFMDDVAAQRQRADDDASTSIMAAYRATMAPVTQNIAGTYFRIRAKLDDDLADGPNAEHRLPLSWQLARQNARGQLGDIFQSCAMSALWAENRQVPDDSLSHPMRINGNIPFLRTERYGFSQPPQPLRVVVPVLHKNVEKRQREPEDRDRESTTILQPRKRRRLQAEELMDGIRSQVNALRSQQPEQEHSQYQASDLVQLPAFLQPRKQPTLTNPNDGSSVKIPTILKRRPVMEAVVGGTPPSATSTSLSQPKCFRFQPPTPLHVDSSSPMESGGEDTTEENEVTEEAEEEEETDEIIMEIESPSEPRSAYSAESDEEEVFLSPLPTATVSRVSHLSSAVEAAKAKLSPPLMAPPAGPQPRGSLLQGRTGIGSVTGSESSSGFGSFATVQPSQTTSHSQFVPTVCSSKMYETQSQVLSTGSSMPKISERTTICGEMESTDLVTSMAVTNSSQWSMPAARLSDQTRRMLETTLDMSTYDAAYEEDFCDRLIQRLDDEDEYEKQQKAQSQVQESPSSPTSSSSSKASSKRSELDNDQEDQIDLAQSHDQEPPLSPTRSSTSAASSKLSSPEMRGGNTVSPSDEESEGDVVPNPFFRQVGQEPSSRWESGNLSNRTSTSSEIEPSKDEESEGGTPEEQADSEEERLELQQEVEVTGRSEAGHQQMTYFGASPQAAVQEPVPSPTRSSSSSELSSPEMRQQRQEVELVSSNDEESTGSITTSRSVTHTPEGTFLPSDTNVSQTSSPRASRGPGGDGSPRSLYRANSLETVDDLDTTKGSLEEEEEDDEDDCVIALDGTEVRGYVARPQQATASSSAELFAFKDECADEAAPGPCPSLSLGATVNSDSVAADIIELDSDEENEEQPQLQSQLEQQTIPITGVDQSLKDEVESEMECKEQPEEEQAPAEPDISTAQDEDSRQSPTLAFSEEEANNVSEDSTNVRRLRLRSDDSGGAPAAITPKGRVPKHKALLEVIDEQASLDTSPRTRSRSRRSTVDTEPDTPTIALSNSRRATSLAPSSVDSPKPGRSLRGISEPPDTPKRSSRGYSKSPTQAHTKPTAEPKAVRALRARSRKNSSDISPTVSPIPSESEQPRLRRTTRRQTSGATVNSDSVAADIIELDSEEENEEQPQLQSQLEQQTIPITGVDQSLKDEVESEMECKEQPEEEQAPAEPDISTAQDEDSRQSPTLAFSEEEANNVSEDSTNVRRLRLRSDDSGGAPAAITPKGRVPKHKALLEVIDEQASLDTSPRTRSRSRRSTVDTDPDTPTIAPSNSRRATSLAPSSVDSPKRGRSLRGISEPPDTPKRSSRGYSKSPTQAHTKPTAELKAVRALRARSRKNSSDISPTVSPIPSESEQPRLRHTTRRQTSDLSETGPITSGIQARELRSRRRPASTDDQPTSRSSLTSTPNEGSNDANEPPRKRGRPKK
ncbi:hypothetical protein KR038_001138 [Drosophila bunnanda]|nr:hypothetical protein KR038_001138 [Drosophila bunnanda]